LRRFRGALVLVLILAFMVTSTMARAEWIDDWFDEATYTGPTSFTGQKRGYATGGNLSLRWSPHNDYPVSVSLPRIKAGCGGIDVFMGGMSFANMPEYLTEKLQTLAAAAPAIAFEVALSVLNEQLSDKMDAIEKATDFLNSIQVNDCAISEAVVKDVSHALGKGLAAPTIKTGIETGASDLYQTMKNDINGTTVGQALAQVGAGDGSAKIATCPAEVKGLFSAPSVVQYLLNKNGYIDSDIVDFVRGLVGDVSMSPGGTVATSPAYIAPCPENKPGSSIEALIQENGYKRDITGGACQKITGITISGHTYDSISDWTGQMIALLVDKMKNKQSITPGSDLDKFVAMMPAPIYFAMQNAVLQQNDSNLEPAVMDMASKAVMWKIMSDLYSVIQTSMAKADEIMAKQKGGSDSIHCDVAPATQEAMAYYLEKIRDTVRLYQVAAQNDYQASLGQLEAMEQQNQRVIQAKAQLHRVLSNAFGESVAARVMESRS